MNIRILGLALLIFLNGNCLSAKAKSPEKLEPPFWWVGMKNPKLQLLVYAEKVAATTPVINYPGVELLKVNKVENRNYLFLDLNISEKAQAGKFKIQFNKSGKTVYEYNYELLNRSPNSSQRQGFSSADVIYLLFPDRFANGDTVNDSMKNMLEKACRSNPNGRHGGDIKGISEHLNYIKDLGFTTVWLNPLLENNMSAFSYHGYAITDFYKVDERFGTNKDYKNLISKMHKMDMRIIMDMIFNHCGSNHWWIKDLPCQDWIHQFPEFTRSNFRGGTVSDIHASDYDRNILLKGWFDTSMPDLNQHNGFLANYLIQNSIWWIEYAGLDGIRMDTYPYPFKDVMAEWAKRVLEEYPDFSIVGEAWLSEPAQVAYWQNVPNIKTGYNSNLPYIMDFPMADAFRYAFNEKDGWSTGIVRMYDILSQDYLYSEPSNIVTFADNHDGDRIFTKLEEDLDNYKLAMTFLVTTRGVPQIYYGTEILMTGYENRGHGDIRKDFPGGWPGDKKNAFTENDRNNDENAAFNYLKTLLNWRKNKTVIHNGKLKHFIPVDGVYVYFRYDENETVMVVLNNSERKQTLEKNRYLEMTGKYKQAKDILSGKMFDTDNILVPAKSALVFELQ